MDRSCHSGEFPSMAVTRQSVAQNIQSPAEQPIEEDLQRSLCAVNLVPMTQIPQEELNKKAKEVVDLVKPIMIQYDLANLNIQYKKQ